MSQLSVCFRSDCRNGGNCKLLSVNYGLSLSVSFATATASATAIATAFATVTSTAEAISNFN